jgi:hypothetical protein
LTGDAVAQLIPLASAAPLENLGPIKQLLKRFFSAEPWTTAEDDALADLIGAGEGAGTHELAGDLVLNWGWKGGPFRIRVELAQGASDRGRANLLEAGPDGSERPRDQAPASWSDTFGGVVVPEVTPSPRSIRFATPPIHTGASRSYESAGAAADDPGAVAVFAVADEVTNVLVGPDFVAVTIRHADDWDRLLEPLLHAVTEAFVAGDVGSPAAPSERAAPARRDQTRPPRQVEQAWSELGRLRADEPADLERIVAAAGDDEPARRQVAATLLGDAPTELALPIWEQLLDDTSRTVRRSAVDAAADVADEAVRPLLERALDDPDAWTRWKALHGIAALGIEPSRSAVQQCASDDDFRVRLEAARLLGAI